MVADPTRVDAYARALRQAIKPSSTVLELGSGTGVFALLACKFGARRVYAIEPNNAILVARANAAANGFADRIQFIQDVSTHISVPEKVDVLVSDLRGILPLFGKHLPSIVDARARFLLPEGIQIPLSDRIMAAPVEVPDEYKEHVLGHDSKMLGVNVEAAVRHTCNTQFKVNLNPKQLLAEAQFWAALDYTSELPTDYAGVLEWALTRKCTCHGIAVWFDAVLSEGISYSNAPGQPCAVYRQIFLPWPKATELNKGDVIRVALKADLIGEDYFWRWDSRVIDPKRPDQMKESFQQSDFFSVPRDPARFRKRIPTYIPNLSEEGEIDRFVLNAMDGVTPLERIAPELHRRFPGRFQSIQDALNWVAAASMKYSS
jgi:protein arginine N-methyltransferase 1